MEQAIATIEQRATTLENQLAQVSQATDMTVESKWQKSKQLLKEFLSAVVIAVTAEGVKEGVFALMLL